MSEENIGMETVQKKSHVQCIIFVICVLSLIGMAGYTGYKYMQLKNKYQEIWDVQISKDELDSKAAEIETKRTEINNKKAEIEAKKLEIDNLTKNLSDMQVEFNNIKEINVRKEQQLTEYTDTKLQKEAVLSVYEENVRQVEEAKQLVMQSLGYEVPDYLEDESYENSWRNNVIGDLAGNSLVGEGIIGGLDAAEKELSLDSILSGVKEGIGNGVPSFTTDSLTDILAGETGSGVVGAVSFITDVFSVNDVPEPIVNELIYAQERYATYLHNFIKSEQVSPRDIRWAADSYYQVYKIKEQLTKATDGQVVSESAMQEIYNRLIEIAEQYQANNEYLLLYTGEIAE